MPVTVKSAKQIELMRESGRILAIVHEELQKFLKPGITTMDIDRLGEEIIRDYGCVPNFKNYQGYPASICVSVNDEVVHGIPSHRRYLHEGDIVSLDAGLIYKGYHSDAARTWGIGEISPQAQQLIDVTRECFFEGMKYAKAGNYLYQISSAIQSHAEKNGFSVFRELTGHGIGSRLHEEPNIPNYKPYGNGLKLKAGMTLAVEPMLSEGGPSIECLDDDWTVITADGSLAAHYENTILITESGYEILTKR